MSQASSPHDERPAGAPSVLVFDVNETLIDIDSLAPQFERIFGDPAVLRTWFGELVMYSMTLTLSGFYADFFDLGQAVLRMLAEIRGVEPTEEERRGLTEAMRTMPAHPDAAPGLERLLADGYRLVTLTNSPHRPNSISPLENAGLSRYFEQQFTVDGAGVYKPSTHLYRRVASTMGTPVAECMMVAAHTWDTIGAQGAGMRGALITRPGNATLPIAGVPGPHVIAPDIVEFASAMRTFDWTSNAF
ncbi:haloacid dehalogenase (plasmid) [Mycolicibacterium arabiense]|uniref:Haloacid dehalogenase n=1 Tax=Mycolicibacterium arabiense TaxID=1286181 RepID=A0A7I7RQI2_9MYCO|nr:haloacid dehalogenase type II [Mycolicibacterium arabiense]MCV7372196.1 haloacid dehalogenase type II [Mycolicibacterium arabiense]BBY46783.1 haloacid dehalogenase [Mycolicibacterium arabiense]